MKTKRNYLTTTEIINRSNNGEFLGGAPLDIGIIPNYMGINLCSVDGVEWIEYEDGQLVSVEIKFKKPSLKQE